MSEPDGKKKKYIKSRSRDTRPMAMISAICFTFMSLISSQLSKEMYGLILHWYSTVAGIFILKKTRVSMWTRCSLNSPRDDYAARDQFLRLVEQYWKLLGCFIPAQSVVGWHASNTLVRVTWSRRQFKQSLFWRIKMGEDPFERENRLKDWIQIEDIIKFKLTGGNRT
jgi:hypothetical protein